jgi:sulfopyruvate decarboxylase TPP-binding subunit
VQSLTVDRRTVSKDINNTNVRQEVTLVHERDSTGILASADPVGKPKAMLMMASDINNNRTPLQHYFLLGQGR